MLGMAPARFFAINVLSALLWAPVHILPGVVFGASIELAGRGVVPARRGRRDRRGGGAGSPITSSASRCRTRARGPARRGSACSAWGRAPSGPLGPRRAAACSTPRAGGRPRSRRSRCSCWCRRRVFFSTLEDIAHGDPIVQVDMSAYRFLQSFRSTWADDVLVDLLDARQPAHARGARRDGDRVDGCRAALAHHRVLARRRGVLASADPRDPARDARICRSARWPRTRALSRATTSRRRSSSTASSRSWSSGASARWRGVLVAVATVVAVIGRHARGPLLRSLHALRRARRRGARGDLGLPRRADGGVAASAKAARAAVLCPWPCWRWSAWPSRLQLATGTPFPTAEGAQRPGVVVVTPAQWTDKIWRTFSCYRSNMEGDRREPITVQWAADRRADRGRSSKAAGWSEGTRLSAHSLLSLVSPNVTATALPVLPKLNNGEPSRLEFVRSHAGADERDVLRFWPTQLCRRAPGRRARRRRSGSARWCTSACAGRRGRSTCCVRPEQVEPMISEHGESSPWHDIEVARSMGCEGVRGDADRVARAVNAAGSRRGGGSARRGGACNNETRPRDGAAAAGNDGRSAASDTRHACGDHGLGQPRPSSSMCFCTRLGVPVPAVPVLVLRGLGDRARHALVHARPVRGGARRADRRRRVVHGGPHLRTSADQPARALLALDRLQRADDARALRAFRRADRGHVQVRAGSRADHAAADGHDAHRGPGFTRLGRDRRVAWASSGCSAARSSAGNSRCWCTRWSSTARRSSTCCVALALLYLAYRYVRRWRLRRWLHDLTISAEQLDGMMRSGAPPVVLDARLATAVSQEPYRIPGALLLDLNAPEPAARRSRSARSSCIACVRTT